MAAFHCQQAVEKTLKAFLVWRSVRFERVHSLVYLIDLCEAQDAAFAVLREYGEFGALCYGDSLPWRIARNLT
jgi:HEPN domain-containing protein